MAAGSGPFARLWARTRQDPVFLGYWLGRAGWTPETLAAALGVPLTRACALGAVLVQPRDHVDQSDLTRALSQHLQADPETVRQVLAHALGVLCGPTPGLRHGCRRRTTPDGRRRHERPGVDRPPPGPERPHPHEGDSGRRTEKESPDFRCGEGA